MKQQFRITHSISLFFLLLPAFALQFIAISGTNACTIFRMKAKISAK
jgi:hypothetical protein